MMICCEPEQRRQYAETIPLLAIIISRWPAMYWQGTGQILPLDLNQVFMQ